MKKEKELREHLVKLMRSGQAFRPLEELVQGITPHEAGKKADHLPYTLWQLLEHMRFTQHDILDFCRNPNYRQPNWPHDYWPASTAPENEATLQNTIKAIHKELEEMVKLVQDQKNDLFAPIPHGNGQTLLREAMLVAEHNAYHLGQIVVLRRLLNKFQV